MQFITIAWFCCCQELLTLFALSEDCGAVAVFSTNRALGQDPETWGSRTNLGSGQLLCGSHFHRASGSSYAAENSCMFWYMAVVSKGRL